MQTESDSRLPRSALEKSARARLVWPLLGLIRGYQLLISPMLGPRCRFYPSCSEYACQALMAHGPVRGIWLAVVRLVRCHPWGGHGHDPVPQRSPVPDAGTAAGKGVGTEVGTETISKTDGSAGGDNRP